MRHQNIKTLISVACMTLISIPAYAIPVSGSSVNIADEYIGARYVNGGITHKGDVIGDVNLFQIFSMDVDYDNGLNVLTVVINTNFAGRAGDGLFSGYIKNTSPGYTPGAGIGYGDLFLSNGWNPFGASPYRDDHSANGEVWEYGFSLNDRYLDDSMNLVEQAGVLYSLNAGNNNANAYLSEDFVTGATFRNGQEIAVDLRSDVTAVSTGSWIVDDAANQVVFMIDLTGTSLEDAAEIGLHWGMTCGNDVIEGGYTVPEPSIVLLLGSGLVGLTLIRRKLG